MEVSHTNPDFVLAKFANGEFGDIEKGFANGTVPEAKGGTTNSD